MNNLKNVQIDGSAHVRESSQQLKLGDFVEVLMGQSPPGDDCNTRGEGVPLLNGPTEFGTHHPMPAQWTVNPRKCAKQGDLLFCVRGSTTGRMNWADQKYAIGRGIAAVRHRTSPELQPLVRGVIDLELPGLLQQATGSTFPNVSRDQLNGLPWPNLAFEEQKRIAHILGTLDDKIDLNRRMSATLEEIARAIFKSWFIDFDPVRAKSEGACLAMPPEISSIFPSTFQSSPLGPIPTGWALTALSEVLAESTERIGTVAAPEYASTNSGLVPRSELFSKSLSASNEKNKAIRPGYLVFGMSRQVLNFGLMRFSLGSVSSAYRVFKVNQDLVDPDLLERLIRMRADYFYNVVSSSSREGQSISPDALKRLFFARPSLTEQRAFYEVTAGFCQRLDLLRQEVHTLEGLRDLLLPELLSGEIRFKEGVR